MSPDLGYRRRANWTAEQKAGRPLDWIDHALDLAREGRNFGVALDMFELRAEIRRLRREWLVGAGCPAAPQSRGPHNDDGEGADE